MKNILLTVGGLLLISQKGFSQSADLDFYFDPNFAIAIIAGVIIAVGVQIFLTALSIASGITAIGDLKKMYIRNSVRSSDDETYMSNEDDSDDNDSSNTGTTVATGVGAWAVITLGISSFAGSLLAMNLVPVASIEMAITVALVIWALFSIVVAYYETKMIGVIVGGISSVATSGFRMSSNMMKSAFGSKKSRDPKVLIDHTVEKVRDELKNELDVTQLNEVVDRFINKVDNKVPDYGTLKEDLEEIMMKAKTEVEANAEAKTVAVAAR